VSEIFFVLKSFFVAAVLLIMLQVKVGPTTLEEKATIWLSDSPFAHTLREVAQGGVIVIGKMVKKVSVLMSDEFAQQLRKENVPGHRELKFGFERSKKYLNEQAEKLARETNEKLED
jgi:hypothetical protein